ncbi:PREDICTED: SLAM family member 5-like [Elephantulus edwardii]|uniref:SLAM family member 5-like n=1 Tax=Elephantulus edwardii TaxID=28737 RepID=UPI0003F0C02B|nr:PREDICTED: SLAM family member 5-like [Elephantulus edwardii]
MPPEFPRSEAAAKDASILMVNGTLGESVTFPINIQEAQQVISIAWISKSSVAVVQPGDLGKAPKVTVTNKNYFERLHVSGKNYDLVMSNLKMEDSGFYQADINIQSSNITITKKYNFQVYRSLKKPKITQNLTTNMNGSCNITLTCSMEKEGKDVTYRWSPMGVEGNTLKVFLIPEDQKLTYTCTAWNPVSNNSDSISIQHLCAGTAMSFRTRCTGLLSVLALVIFLILILSVVCLFNLYKKRQGRILPEGKIWQHSFVPPGNEVMHVSKVM